MSPDHQERPADAGAHPADSTASAPDGPRHILTILAVADLERAARFYGEAFGWPVVVDVPVYVEMELPGGQRLGVYRREGFARNTGQMPQETPRGAITGTEVYLRCADVDAAAARLERAGARLLSARASRPWGDDAAYFADPDGNVLVVASPSAPDEQRG